MKQDKYVSIKEVFGEIMSHPMLKELTLDRIVTYAVEFCRKWGASILFEEKSTILDVENYRAYLPCDFYSLIAVRDTKTGLNYRASANVWHTIPGEYDYKVARDINNKDGIVDSKASFNGDYENKYIDGIISASVGNNNHSIGSKPYQDLTYKLNGNVLFLSLTGNQIEVMYQAIKSDEEGYPMVLDDATYIQALQDYIKLKYFTILFDCGKIQAGVLQNTQQQYAFSARVLQSHLVSLSPDEAVTIGNILQEMLTYRTHHNGFRNAGMTTKFKIH